MAGFFFAELTEHGGNIRHALSFMIEQHNSAPWEQFLEHIEVIRLNIIKDQALNHGM